MCQDLPTRGLRATTPKLAAMSWMLPRAGREGFECFTAKKTVNAWDEGYANDWAVCINSKMMWCCLGFHNYYVSVRNKKAKSHVVLWMFLSCLFLRSLPSVSVSVGIWINTTPSKQKSHTENVYAKRNHQIKKEKKISVVETREKV